MFSSEFGSEFIWGTSISAPQTESAHLTDGKEHSIWDEFCDRKKWKYSTKTKIKNNHHLKQSTDFYYHFEQDIFQLKILGFKHFRFSIAWSRIMPDGENINTKGIEFYHKVIDCCIKNNITPWVTLYHWDLPLALENKGGWVNPEIQNWFEKYTIVCITNFTQVKHWMILNEPSVFTGAGYFFGNHAPGKKGLNNFIFALKHANLCQNHAFHVIKNFNSNLQVGSTFSFTDITSYDSNIRHVKAAELADTIINRLFFEPVIGQGYPLENLTFLNKYYINLLEKDANSLKTPFDFIGVQNYTREVFKHNPFNPFLKIKQIPATKRTKELTAMNWEIYPPSIYNVLKKINQYNTNIPLIITESGIALYDKMELNKVNDQKRIEYYKAHLKQALKAKNEGIDLRGFFAWSLLDNFEWAEGYHPRFGLIHVDFHTKVRTPKNSANWFKDFLLDL